jgi:hypothetical protein
MAIDTLWFRTSDNNVFRVVAMFNSDFEQTDDPESAYRIVVEADGEWAVFELENGACFSKETIQ